MKKVLLFADGVCKAFGAGKKGLVLNHVSTDIYEGDFTVIMGASGAGKSTLLYALSGMDRITGGRVFYKEREISRMKEQGDGGAQSRGIWLCVPADPPGQQSDAV